MYVTHSRNGEMFPICMVYSVNSNSSRIKSQKGLGGKWFVKAKNFGLNQSHRHETPKGAMQLGKQT